MCTARKLLWEEIKSIKRSKPNAKCQIVYPAKLLVDGKIVRDEFPDWSEAMKGSRLRDFSLIEEMEFSRDVYDQTPVMQRDNVNVGGETSEAEMSFTLESASPVPNQDPTLDETLPPTENDTRDIEHSQSWQSSQSLIAGSKTNDLPDQTTDSRPPNPLFRPFNEDIIPMPNSENLTKIPDNSNSEIPKHDKLESRTKQRGLRRVHSLSLPRELTKTGTSKVVKPGSKNSAKSSLSRVSRTKETVTAQGASGGASNDNTVTTDDNSPRPSNTSNEQCYVSQEKVCLRFSLLNAQGLISRRTNKLKSPELKHIFNTSDLVLFTESWTEERSDLNVNDFEHFVLNRKLVKANSRRNSGGIVLYIRNKWVSKDTLVYTSEDDFLWIKLSKNVIFSDKDLYVCLCYVTPTTVVDSRWLKLISLIECWTRWYTLKINHKLNVIF